MRAWAAFLLAALTAARGADTGYVNAQPCAPCHRPIYDTYRRTGMGQSFSRRAAPDAKAATYYHAASDQHFTMYQRGGRYYQRRVQIGPDGGETNVVEMQIDFVLGSGRHARTYLHQAADGRLVELPLAWYSENGGTWAMNPGYDRADHMDFRRKIDKECVFCHNAYPEAEEGAGPELVLRGPVPVGIDCQRCHGPGRAHVESAKAGATLDAIRGAIVNPARLDSARQLELCFQCHLESTSHRLPYAVRRYGRGFFSYRPGEPLEDYILHFDHAPGAGYDDKFEIDHAAYRLLKSACFRKSSGALTCTTCHNPHEEQGGGEAIGRYIRACKSCHADAHRAAENCLECHMPKRRTEDVVHAVMTDHFILRDKPDRDLLTPIQETHDTERTAYRGEVVLLDPQELPATGESELYLAIAQVIDGANLSAGIPRLRQAIDQYRPARAEFYLELGNAYGKSGQPDAALSWYEEALRRDPRLLTAQRNYAQTLSDLGRVAEAIRTLEGAPRDAATLNALGAAWLHFGRPDQAVAALRRALVIDAGVPEVYVNLSNALSREGNKAGAMDALRNAIRLQPGSAAAHNNLASILDARGDFAQARYHFERAIRSDPSYAVAHYNFGRALAEKKLYAEAESHLSTALKLDPQLAEAAVSLGLALARTGQLDRAIESYRQALRIKPDLIGAHFNLGLALLSRGERAEAKQHFETVIQSNAKDYEACLHLGKILLDEGRYESAIMNLQTASQSRQPDVRKAALDALRAAKSAK